MTLRRALKQAVAVSVRHLVSQLAKHLAALLTSSARSASARNNLAVQFCIKKDFQPFRLLENGFPFVYISVLEKIYDTPV